MLSSGAEVSGIISLIRGGVLQIDSPAQATNYFPAAARLGIDADNIVIDLRSVGFDSKGSASVVSGSELKVAENGFNYFFGLQSGLIGGRLHLSPDGAGGSMVTVIPPNPVLFAGFDSAGRNQLWRTDGTTAGTVEITGGEGFGGGIFSNTSPDLLQVRSEVIFNGKDATGRNELWRTDGTAEDTSEISVAGAASFGLAPSGLVPLTVGTFAGNKAVFAGNGADGTSAGTSEIATGGPNGLQPTQLTVLGSSTVVFAGVDFTGSGLWVTDGSQSGTSEILPANAASGGLNPADLTRFGSEALFAGKDNSGNNNLWVTDGTSSGTSELTVAGVHSGGIFSSGGHATNPDFTVLSGHVLFNGVDSGGNAGLWVTDGTIADTHLNSSTFSGTVSGFGGANHANHKQFIDLVSVASAPNTISLSYVSSASHTSGTLFVSSGGAVVAAINMVGAYTSTNFSAKADGHGNVEIIDPPVVSGGSVQLAPVQALPRHGIDQPVLGFGGHGTLAYSQAATVGNTPAFPDGRHAATIALLVNYMAGNFATAADGRGATLISEAPQTEHAPLLARPHG